MLLPSLFGSKLCGGIERVRTWIQVKEISFLQRVAGLSHRDRVMSQFNGEGQSRTAPAEY